MSVLSMMEARLPPGFRFHPWDDELVCDYLEKKISGCDNGSYQSFLMLIDVDLNNCEPWDLPEIGCLGGKEWYFFSLRDRKYATGQRTNRATQSGYWKATGKDRQVVRKGVLVGMRKTLVFYQGRAPKGKKTDWIMHEFRMETSTAATDSTKVSIKAEDWVLCRVFFKSRNTKPNPTPPPTTTTFNPSFRGNENASSSLPHLMDTYITLDNALGNHLQTQMSLQGFHELHAPCFSNPLPASPLLQPACHLEADVDPRLMSPLVNCERKMIMVVLSHLNKLEGGQKRETSMSSGDGVVESYLSTEGGLQNM